MIIKFPSKLTPTHSINFAKYIYDNVAHRVCEYDFTEIQHCRPFGLLISMLAIQHNIKVQNDVHPTIRFNRESEGIIYAGNMGFFEFLDDESKQFFHSARQTENNLPITKIYREQVDQMGKTNYGEAATQISHDLANKLIHDDSSESKIAIEYCLREIIRNAFEHGNANEVWVCGQYWPSRNEAEIAIADSGIGILASLSSNPRFSLKNDAEANNLALQPGASRMLGRRQDSNDIWQNSGYGLYLASALCAKSGYFCLCSGRNMTLVNTIRQVNYDSLFQGTAVGMQIKLPKATKFDDQIKCLVKQGEKTARALKGSRVITASKASTITGIINS